MAMQHCWCQSFTKVISEEDDMSTKFKEVELRWIKRSGNAVADKLAKANIPNDASYEFYVMSLVSYQTLYIKTF